MAWGVKIHEVAPVSTLIIIQARMGSQRLPGKALKPLGGKPSLWWVTEAARQVRPVVVAIPGRAEDKLLARHVASWGIRVFAWPRLRSADVLGRYTACARHFNADPIIRLTGDCPAHDPDIIRRTLAEFEAKPHDYLFSHWLWDLPRGREVEVFSRSLLEEAHTRTTDLFDREHVTPWLRRKVGDREARYTGVNLCLDTIEDYHQLEALWPVSASS